MRDLFRNHVLTRAENPNTKKLEWCICRVEDDKLLPPLVFGENIEDAIHALEELILTGDYDVVE